MPINYLIAILPGCLLAYLIYRLDKYDKEPLSYLLTSFFLGMLATYPPFIFQKWISKVYPLEEENWEILFFYAFVVIAVSEELIKFLVLLLYALPKKAFNEPLDGIVYSVMIAMGFATIENLYYAKEFGIETTVIRAFTAIPAHGVFAVIMGYFTGIAKFRQFKYQQLAYLTAAIIFSILAHGLYDLFLIQRNYEWLVLLACSILFAAMVIAYSIILKQRRNSPIKKEQA